MCWLCYMILQLLMNVPKHSFKNSPVTETKQHLVFTPTFLIWLISVISRFSSVEAVLTLSSSLSSFFLFAFCFPSSSPSLVLTPTLNVSGEALWSSMGPSWSHRPYRCVYTNRQTKLQRNVHFSQCCLNTHHGAHRQGPTEINSAGSSSRNQWWTYHQQGSVEKQSQQLKKIISDVVVSLFQAKDARWEERLIKGHLETTVPRKKSKLENVFHHYHNLKRSREASGQTSKEPRPAVLC